jgi:hypothetical protein
VFLLVLIAFQDLKSRSYGLWLWVTTLAICVYSIFFSKYQTSDIAVQIGFNLAVVLLYLGIVSVYIKFRFKKNEVLNYIALGDWLFFVLLTLMFSTPVFLIILPLSLLSSLLLHFVFSLHSQYNSKRVPLAGLQALFLAVIVMLDEINYTNLVFNYNVTNLYPIFTFLNE